jgi:hypothetical protein
MRSVYRPTWLMLWISVLALSACVTLGNTRDQRLRDYEASVREEADWLWNNMNYVRTHFYPDDAYCKPEYFEHKSVPLTPEQRQADLYTANLADQLDYAEVLIQQAHDEWDRFCAHESSAPTTAAVLEKRLLLAYESMNGVRVALAPSQATPQPGST